MVYRLTGALVVSGGVLLVRLNHDEAQACATRLSGEATLAQTGFRRRSLGRKR